jgi:hypothetical protein
VSELDVEWILMVVEIFGGKPFWQFSDGQTLNSADLACRMTTRLIDLEVECGRSVIVPGY